MERLFDCDFRRSARKSSSPRPDIVRHKKSKEKLEAELSEQLLALRASAKAYDEGNHWEAKRLSSTIYILLHDGGHNSRSLLGLLGKKGGLRLVSSKVVPPSQGTVVAASSTLIVHTRLTGSGAEYVPVLDDHPLRDQYRWLQFDRWWEEQVFHPVSSTSLSRKNIIFTMRSQDGGAHVDDAITNADYVRFDEKGDPSTRYHSPGTLVLTTSEAKQDSPSGEAIKNGIRATVRQIAWEVDHSLSKIAL